MPIHHPPERRARRPWHRTSGRATIGVAVLLLVLSSATTLRASADAPESGNIGTAAIQIDTPNAANLYPSPATTCVGNAFDAGPLTATDWVKDCLANSSFDSSNSAAAKGHLNGYRVLDKFGGNDQDIFLTGGKEQDLSTWNPGPGTVGSSKYDITQAYIANNKTDAFFGMERRGNNGTTAFDWEFNRLAPSASNPSYLPTRSECDVLVTFEMQGSGGSGSATTYIFRYDDPDSGTGAFSCDGYTPASGYAGDTDKDGRYVLQSNLSGVVASINNNPVPSAPWGTVDSKGSWTTGSIDRFQFAEAKVPLTLLGINPADTCTDISRYLQVRTRSSSTDNSDLKDLTTIRAFSFFAPQNPTTTVSAACDASFHFASNLTTGTAPTWTFHVPAPGDTTTVTLTGKDGLVLTPQAASGGEKTWTTQAFSGDVQVGGFPPGSDPVTITVDQSAAAEAGGCQGSSNGSTVTVYRGQSVSATPTVHCDGSVDWTASVTGGKAPYDMTVDLQHQNADLTWSTVKTYTATDDADGVLTGTTSYADLGTPGTWRVKVTSTDSQQIGPDGLGCTVTDYSGTFQVRAPLVAAAVKDAANTNGSTFTAAVSGSATGALSGDTVTYQWQKGVPDGSGGTTWSNISGATGADATYASFESDVTPSAVSFSIGSGAAAGSYKGKLWEVKLRVHVTRTVGTLVCSDNSPAVDLSLVKGVDP